VSLVLRDKPGIGAETRQRVWAVAEELGYQRRLTSPLESGRNVLNVGLIMRSRTRSLSTSLPLVNRFYSWVLAGVEAAARTKQMNLLYATLPVDDANAALDLPEHLLSQRLDGVLLVGTFSEQTIDEVARRTGNAIVLVDVAVGAHNYDAIVSDNLAGAYQATCYLIDRGHRRIAFVSPSPEANPNFEQRRDGFLKAIEEHGLETFAPPVEHQDVGPATTSLLEIDPPITGIVGCNDLYAIEAMRSAQRLGKRVPDDLSCIGFDDVELATASSPQLTTMVVDKISMGRLAVQALSYRIAWPEAAQMMTVLRPSLIERESVACISD
jgi:LacI family transcriptional regulator